MSVKSEHALKERTEVLQRRQETADREPVRFVQVSKSMLTALATLAVQAPRAHFLLLMLVERMDRENSLLISQDTLCDELNITRPTLQRAVKVLRDENWIDVTKVGTTNVYTINAAVFWQQRTDKKERFAKFTARVYATSKEQDKDKRAAIEAGERPKLRPMVDYRRDEEVIVTGTELGNEPPPEQAMIDFYKAD